MIDTDCVNGAACNVTGTQSKNHCIPYMSIQPHMPVGVCATNQVSNLCSSGYCQTTGLNTYACMAIEPSINYLPMKCGSSVDCRAVSDDYFSDGQLYGTCQCGYNVKGQSYCSLFPGDPS